MGRCQLLVPLLVWGGVGCKDSLPPPPTLESITPEEAPSNEVTEVLVHGRDFHPRMIANLDTGETAMSDSFSVFLRLAADGATPVELQQVARSEDVLLTGVVPAGLQAGSYTAWVRGPYGDSAVVSNALEIVFTPDCDDPENEGCPCDYLGSTVGVCAGGGARDADGACSVPPAGYEDPETTCGDGLDNDCDGSEDEGCPCDYLGSTTGVCAGGGTLDETGACSVAPAAYESPEESCSDGADNDCNGLPDGLDPACGGVNTPPVPAILVTPGSGLATDVYTADATGTWDREEDASSLLYAWDWEGDGVFEANGPVVQKSDYTPGEHLVVLRVTDLGGFGASAYATFPVLVAEPPTSYVLEVTTDQDHGDAETYPGPYNLGLSLREAITLANGQLSGNLVTIRFLDAYTIVLNSVLPASTDPSGLWIVGDGVTVDGTAATSGPCFELRSDNARIYGLRIIDCPAGAVTFSAGTGGVVSRCTIERSGEPQAGSAAVQIYTNATLGPGNVIADGPGNGVYVPSGGDASVIVGNRIYGSGVFGVRVTVAAMVAVRQNVIYGNSQGGIGIPISCDGCKLTHNTIHGNTGAGVSISNNSSGVDFRNNIVSNNTGDGLDCAAGNFSGGFNDYNDYWGNTVDDCTCCGGSLPANSLAVDPIYVDLASDGYLFRLMPTSTLIDAGVDTGVDTNGPEPGAYNGSFPDIGAWEAPAP